MSADTPKKPVHLVVLQHGLWGCPDNLSFVEGLLLEHANQHAAACGCVRTLNSPVNFQKLTYDGIDVCG